MSRGRPSQQEANILWKQAKSAKDCDTCKIIKICPACLSHRYSSSEAKNLESDNAHGGKRQIPCICSDPKKRKNAKRY